MHFIGFRLAFQMLNGACAYSLSKTTDCSHNLYVTIQDCEKCQPEMVHGWHFYD